MFSCLPIDSFVKNSTLSTLLDIGDFLFGFEKSTKNLN